ncbi:MAG: hypothetical protein KDD99_17770 [Bacteroidetes bacterium]|nr:hypothetical protein [Bacteroidota bacterium]
MTLHFFRTGCAIGCYLWIFLAYGFSQDNPKNFEDIINDYLGAYELEPDNLFRLAAYTEMKGKYSSEYQTLTLDFGDLGQMAFYEKNVLLRTQTNRVYHMDKNRESAALSTIMNRNLSSLFEKIILLSNHDADPAQIAFVDKHLARKNIEPFDKIFLRHILIRYGKFDQANQRVVFHTDWMAEEDWSMLEKNGKTVSKPSEPIKIKLDAQIVRGYYLWSGGTVYVENVNRDVVYATGENYSYNVAAFKLMLQKLFSQTTHFVVAAEQDRINRMPDNIGAITDLQINLEEDSYVVLTPERMNTRGMNTINPNPRNTNKSYIRPGQQSQVTQNQSDQKDPAFNSKIRQLYSPYAWIPMMLGILRSNGVNIGDEDVIKYFINQPYFPRLYDQLTREERKKVDSFRDN